MYKTYFFLEGPAGSDPFRHTTDEAAQAIARSVAEAVGYTQTRTLGEQIDPAAEPPFTGVAELWFSDPTDALASTPQAVALRDLLTADTRVGPIVTGWARTVMRLPEHHDGGHIKGVFPFRRQPQLSVPAFQRYWWLTHGPVAARTEMAVYYLQCHPLPATYERGRPPYDGVTELHWPDVDSARAAMRSRQMIEDQFADAQNFVEDGSVVLFLAREEVVIAA